MLVPFSNLRKFASFHRCARVPQSVLNQLKTSQINYWMLAPAAPYSTDNGDNNEDYLNDLNELRKSVEKNLTIFSPELNQITNDSDRSIAIGILKAIIKENVLIRQENVLLREEKSSLIKENTSLKIYSDRFSEELSRLRTQRKHLIQGHYVKMALQNAKLWKSYVEEDSIWGNFPVEIRNAIKDILKQRNKDAHHEIDDEHDLTY